MTLEEAMKSFLFNVFIYKGEQLNFGRKNKNFPEWYEKHKHIKGKVGVYTFQAMINTMSYLAFYIDDGELDN